MRTVRKGVWCYYLVLIVRNPSKGSSRFVQTVLDITLLIYMSSASREGLAKHKHHHSFMNNLIGAVHATSLCNNVLFIARTLTSYIAVFLTPIVPSHVFKYYICVCLCVNGYYIKAFYYHAISVLH